MEFYLYDDDKMVIATFEYLESLEDCETCKGIVIKKGSKMSKAAYCIEKWLDCKWVDDLREELVEKNIVDDLDDQYFIFKEDVEYNSPAKAVSVVLGHNEKDSWNILFNKEGNSLQKVMRF
jgi:hypothetical protein